MTLDAASRQKTLSWLASKGSGGCPACKGEKLVVEDVIGVTLVSSQLAEKKSNPADIERYVSVSCTDCEYVMLYRASAVGI
jgi:predicted nucleic-acid-binding Zn-ribbon protein